MRRCIILILLLLQLTAVSVRGQEPQTYASAAEDTFQKRTQQENEPVVLTPEELDISEKMDEYFIGMAELTSTIAYVNFPGLKELERKLQALNLKWKTYTEIQQIIISGSDYLLENLSRFDILYVSASDSLAAQKVRLEAVGSFTEAETRMKEYLPVYEKLLSDAENLSLIKQTSAQLGRLKAGEQLTLSEVQTIYDKARQCLEQNPSLRGRMDTLEEDFITIRNCSEKIQACEFKPWISRIKDYILTLAGVSVIVMFITMMKSRIDAAKAARESAEKYKEMLGQNDEYPTI